MNHEDEPGDKENPGLPDAERADQSGSAPRTYLILFLAIVSVAALVFSAYVFQQTGNLKKDTEELKILKQEISTLEAGLEEETRRSREMSSSINAIEKGQSLLQDNLNSMYKSQKQEDIDWTLAEIEHLLIIATQELALDGDVDTALAALESADDRLRDITSPAVLKIRTQITSDINSLKAVNTVDIPGMALYMVDIINRVESLPLKTSGNSSLKTNDGDKTNVETEQPSLWKRLLHTMWEELTNLVVITKENETGVLSLLPDQQYYLYQNLRLQLEAARLAILERDTDNLRASLELVIEWLSKYFDMEDSAISNILTSLKQMSRVKLRPDLPDISSSLETLRAFLRDRSPPESALPESGD